MLVVIWILLGVLAIVFMIVGYGKLSGSRSYYFAFIRWRLPDWFRLFTGVVEMLGAFLLFLGIWFATSILFGAILLLLVCIGGTLVHLSAKDSTEDMIPILLLGLLSLILILLLIL
ncbi:MAG: DoxX family protein [Lysinibacillus sp.]